ncbi:ArsR family transcriptional regulator [Lujinxingia litoralis]|uniref:ArsR family transcriptional regulator n=1 Tax=Lujinxingia litoralis TaxID=2211119 RepID=A0A328C9M8_9DELT|nr:ArsR family transcriptional regulator [Lujinxingia litoralis]
MPPVPTDEVEANKHLARLAKAMAHPVRVTILRMLVRQEGCIVGDIVDELPLAQSTISQQLKQLKDAGLIRGESPGARSNRFRASNTAPRVYQTICPISDAKLG